GLLSEGAVIGAEEQHVIGAGQVLRVGVGGAGVGILNQAGACCRSIAGPDFLAVRQVVGVEEELAAGGRQVARVGEVAAGSLDQDRAGGSRVGLVQFRVPVAVAGGEEQGAVDVGQGVGVGAGVPGVDVSDHHGAGCGAVALPKFVAVNPVVG